ncbi:MAG TPA: FtsQ-type POTRA domain-containing protein [Streptosporangiaceae bacterium]|nr:FtsQ-type POTRA domain-containing protein [Streptosporangiaceae bacterium]
MRKTRRGTGRGRDPWRAAFFGLVVVALLAGAAWALLGSSFLVVRSVQVSGSRRVPRAAVLAAAGIRIGTPLIRIDTGAVARRVEQIPQVLSARVVRSWPDAVVIWVASRTAALAVPARGGYDLVDPYGVVLAWQSARPAGLPVLRSPAGPVAALRGNPAVFAAGMVVRGLNGRLRRLVTAVQAAGPGAVTLLLRGGVTVLWGGADREAAKASELVILLRTQARYYDVSDPGTAVTGS